MALFTSRDKGLGDLVRSFKVNAGETKVFVGHLRSSGNHKQKPGEKGQPISVAQIAAIHEFGSADGKIPERSYFRSTMNQIHKPLSRMLKKLSKKVTTGGMSKTTALGIVGEYVLTQIRDKIESNIPPALKPETIKRKGSDKTLIDTGQLRDSLDYEIKQGKNK